MWPAAPSFYTLTASRRAFAGLNDGTFDAGTATGSPVRRLCPWRAARARTVNFPNPAIATGSSRASASAMAENTEPTIRSAAALVVEVSAARWEDEFCVGHVVLALSCGWTSADGASSQ